jgi:hypothetical protein
MKTTDIKKILKENPDALFHIAYLPAKDYYGQPSWVERVANVSIHVNGYLLATDRGHVVLDPRWVGHKPYRITARNVIKPYQEPTNA